MDSTGRSALMPCLKKGVIRLLRAVNVWRQEQPKPRFAFEELVQGPNSPLCGSRDVLATDVHRGAELLELTKRIKIKIKKTQQTQQTDIKTVQQKDSLSWR